MNELSSALENGESMASPWQTLKKQVDTFAANLHMLIEGQPGVDLGDREADWNVLLEGLMKMANNVSAQR